MPYSFASRKMRFWVGPTYAPPRSTHFVSLFWNVKKETNNIFDKIKKNTFFNNRFDLNRFLQTVI